jgi:hypothetical protein
MSQAACERQKAFAAPQSADGERFLGLKIAAGFVVIILLASTTISMAHASEAYNFVKEYARELAALEAIRDNAEKELTQSSSNPSTGMADCIRNGELYRLELNLDISQLKQVRLAKPVDDVPSLILQFYQQKLEQYRQMTEMCSTMIAGPKAGVDYGQLAADMPKITANVEYLDHALFELCPLVFAALIDQRPDKEDRLNHLVISKAERDALVRELDLSFGKKMDQDDQNRGVSAASVLKSYLTKKDYKFADDPW